MEQDNNQFSQSIPKKIESKEHTLESDGFTEYDPQDIEMPGKALFNRHKSRRWFTVLWHWVALVLLLIVATIGVVYFRLTPPNDFPADKIFTVTEGASVTSVVSALDESGYIKSPNALRLWFRAFQPEATVIAGDYSFGEPMKAHELAKRIIEGDFGDAQVSLVIPEGLSVVEIAETVTERLPEFDADTFIALAEGKEGYLFPDTYYIFPSITPESLIKKMEENFVERVTSIQALVDSSGQSLSDLVIMASIIEKEAYGDRRDEHEIISGILWKRMSIDMPLQVDAPFKYLIGKSSEELTLEELRTDSPYNTYTRKGLPVGPIGNPGLLALEAAAQPQDSPYLFYLHDSEGDIHYAVDHDGHVANKRKHLN